VCLCVRMRVKTTGPRPQAPQAACVAAALLGNQVAALLPCLLALFLAAPSPPAPPPSASCTRGGIVAGPLPALLANVLTIASSPLHPTCACARPCPWRPCYAPKHKHARRAASAVLTQLCQQRVVLPWKSHCALQSLCLSHCCYYCCCCYCYCCCCCCLWGLPQLAFQAFRGQLMLMAASKDLEKKVPHKVWE